MDKQQVETVIKYRKYLLEAKSFFEKHSQGMVAENHYNHNMEPNFWIFMINPVLEAQVKYQGKLALEVGCGAGRNLVNLLVAGNFQRVDGLDISKTNALNSQKFVDSKIGIGRTVCLEGNGYTCLPFPSDSYSWVISHQVFIHIPNREIRFSLLKDIFRLLTIGGRTVIHFKTMGSAVSYDANHDSFPMNVTVSKEDFDAIVYDFEEAGFSNVNLSLSSNWVDQKSEIFVSSEKR